MKLTKKEKEEYLRYIEMQIWFDLLNQNNKI